jgi:hypothetical protein
MLLLDLGEELSEEMAAALGEHLAGCERCREERGWLRAFPEKLRAAFPAEPLPRRLKLPRGEPVPSLRPLLPGLAATWAIVVVVLLGAWGIGGFAFPAISDENLTALAEQVGLAALPRLELVEAVGRWLLSWGFVVVSLLGIVLLAAGLGLVVLSPACSRSAKTRAMAQHSG